MSTELAEIMAIIFVFVLAAAFSFKWLDNYIDGYQRSKRDKYKRMEWAIKDYVKQNFVQAFYLNNTLSFEFTDISDTASVATVTARIKGLCDTTTIQFKLELIDGKYKVLVPETSKANIWIK